MDKTWYLQCIGLGRTTIRSLLLLLLLLLLLWWWWWSVDVDDDEEEEEEEVYLAQCNDSEYEDEMFSCHVHTRTWLRSTKSHTQQRLQTDTGAARTMRHQPDEGALQSDEDDGFVVAALEQQFVEFQLRGQRRGKWSATLNGMTPETRVLAWQQ